MHKHLLFLTLLKWYLNFKGQIYLII
jgi:hypothetical protein